MAKYKVKVIAHQLKGKKIAKFGETVDESELMSDASKLVKQGFIEKAKLTAKEKAENLHNERKEALTPYWDSLDDKIKESDLSKMTKPAFDKLLNESKEKAENPG